MRTVFIHVQSFSTITTSSMRTFYEAVVLLLLLLLKQDFTILSIIVDIVLINAKKAMSPRLMLNRKLSISKVFLFVLFKY